MKKKYFLVFAALFILVLWGYLDVLRNPQIYYDDLSNIFNTTVASKNFNWQVVKDVLTFSFGGFRPVSYFSFYLNYLFWGNGTENLYPYIITNVILHFLNALLVFFVAMKLSRDNFKLSFLTAVAWAVSPANSLAVDYLIQRMTELMFFFGMLSFLLFLKYLDKKRLRFLFFSILFLILSILSKQNGVLFIPLFFIYLVWFDYIKVDIKKLYILFVLFYALFLIVMANYFFPKSIVRGFTPFQRFLTETRVLVYYLKVLVLPFPSEVFLYIDFPLSKSLFSPITTLFSSVFLIFLFALSFFLFKRNRLVSFGLLSFFLFHSIEASTIPLYIAFLHRNYVASFFLYFALFSLLFHYLKKDLFVFVAALIIVFNFIFVLKVHNATYTSPFFYLSQNYKSFPENKDLAAALGIRYSKTGQYKKALSLYLKSFRPDKVENRLELIMSAFFNMGCYQCVIGLKSMVKGAVIYQIVGKAYKKKGDFKSAEGYFKKSLAIQFSSKTLFPYLDLLAKQNRFQDILDLLEKYKSQVALNELVYMYKINSYIELGMFSKAEPLFPKLQSKNVYFWLKGKYFLKRGNVEKAIELLNKVKIKNLTPANVFIELQKTLLLSDAYKEKGDFETALKVLEEYNKKGFFQNVIKKQIETIKRLKDGS